MSHLLKKYLMENFIFWGSVFQMSELFSFKEPRKKQPCKALFILTISSTQKLHCVKYVEYISHILHSATVFIEKSPKLKCQMRFLFEIFIENSVLTFRNL